MSQRYLFFCRDLLQRSFLLWVPQFPTAADISLPDQILLAFLPYFFPKVYFKRFCLIYYFVFSVSGKCLEEVCPVVDIQKHLHYISPNSIFIFRSLFYHILKAVNIKRSDFYVILFPMNVFLGVSVGVSFNLLPSIPQLILVVVFWIHRAQNILRSNFGYKDFTIFWSSLKSKVTCLYSH